MKFIITSLALIIISQLSYSQKDTILKTYTQQELLTDYDLLILSLKEAHTGLYWYTTIADFDSLVTNQRAEIKEGMNSYEFFKITSKIVTATKEGHCRIGSSRDIGEYFNEKALILPLTVKMLDNKLYILNDIENHKTKGQVLSKINNISTVKIIDIILNLTPKYADGNITTGKIRFSIDYAGLAYYYADFFENKAINKLEIVNPETNKTSIITANSVSSKMYREIENQIERPSFNKPIELNIDKKRNTAHLSIHSFRYTYYDKEGDEEVVFNLFSSKIDSVFIAIEKAQIDNLIIDIRNNSGGTEGYEDYVFSYLTNKPYSKYKYVQANSLTFSFLEYAQYNTPEKQSEFEKDMENEFYLENDGRYLRKKEFMTVEPPKENPFNGKVLCNNFW